MRPEWVEPVAVASYYHDAAIWFEHTWDYLPDSESLAAQELSRTGHEGDAALVTAMIDEHHRVRLEEIRARAVRRPAEFRGGPVPPRPARPRARRADRWRAARGHRQSAHR